MIPIGIVTKDRIGYLDVTLRSLSATDLPASVPVTLYDDGSQRPDTMRYYLTSEAIDDATQWPETKTWGQDLGLDVVHSTGPILGIDRRIPIMRSERPTGVVNASFRAMCHLFDSHPEAPWIILLQDDVVFKVDWYQRLTAAAMNFQHSRKKPGVLAGLRLNTTIRRKFRHDSLVSSRITAQCLCVSRLLFEELHDYFSQNHSATRRFDVMLRRHARRAGFWVGCLLPFVCQHIGVKSLVRPKWGWHKKGPQGRVGLHVEPPYAMGDRVRSFRRITERTCPVANRAEGR